MKKRLLAILMLLAMLCTLIAVAEEAACEHEWSVYTDNGDGTHTVACELCGEVGETTEHDPDWGKGFSNLGYGLHGMQCKLCDSNEVWLSTHTRMCSDPEGLCITCGADEEETETWLVYHYYYMHDNGDGTHCSICDTCGDVTRSDPHYNYCDGPEGKCNACGAAVEGLERQHYFYSYIDNGDGTHCAVCDACGFVDKENWETHYAKCSDPEGKCAACGAACEEVLHYWDNTPKNAWDGTHVYTCLDCGETRAERHNWDWGVVVKAATETEEGARLFKCQTCDATRRESIAKLPSTQPEVTETPAEVTEPETPVTDETTEEELPVIIEEVVLEEGKLTAELVLEEEVQQLEKLFLRVEYQLANGETRVEVIELDETMKFALDIDADVVHILIELTDTADVLEPGDWTVYGRYEMDVK